MFECAILVALATVLSLLKVYKLPLGGSVTVLSMLPISVLSIRRGCKWGLVGGFLYALLQLFLGLAEIISWGITPLSFAGCVVFDYLIAFTVIGLADLFRSHGIFGMVSGIVLSMLLRFCSHLVSGVLIFDAWMPDGWSSPFWYSVAYNGSYMLPEMIFTIAAVLLLTKTAAFRTILKSEN